MIQPNRTLQTALALSLSLLTATQANAQASAPSSAPAVHLKIIALNDFHGNLQSPGKFRANAASPSVPAGGIDFLAGYVAHLKSENPNNVVVSAGDLTGASPLISSLFHDEDTVEAMNRLGLEIEAVGNHEFDKGRQELLRRQNGGCFPHDENTCKGALTGTPVPFEGAKFQYLAANVIDTATGKTVFPAYAIKTYQGIKVAFIGLTLKDTPSIVIASGVAGLRFEDEADTINRTVRVLRRQGIESFVVLLHEGGFQSTKGTYDINACEGDLDDSPVRAIVGKLDDAVDLVLSAHTHVSYICQIPNRTGRKVPVTSASSYGRLLTDIDVTLSPKTKDITNVIAHNLVVDRTNPAIHPDTAIQHIVERYATLAAPIVDRVIGTVTADLTRKTTPSGEDTLGDLIADAQLEATASPEAGGAVVAFMNEGGIRADLLYSKPGRPDGKITFGELFTAQPFGNDLVTMTLTGAQIYTVLEEQFKGCALGAPAGTPPPDSERSLQISAGFTFTFDPAAAPCHKVDPASLQLNGKPILPAARYRITVNSLLADGGAQFPVFKQGTDRKVGPPDLDAMTEYFAKHPNVAPAQTNRIAVKP